MVMMGFSPIQRNVSAFCFGILAMVKVALFFVAKDVTGIVSVAFPISPSKTSIRAPGV